MACIHRKIMSIGGRSPPRPLVSVPSLNGLTLVNGGSNKYEHLSHHRGTSGIRVKQQP
jgi:hypothetical protein